MRRIIAIVFSLLSLAAYSQEKTVESILYFIQQKSDIQEGGSGYFQYDGTTYVVTVSSVIVGNKTESNCKTVGSTKAKRDMMAFINGSEITSYTELTVSEDLTETLGGRKVEATQSYKEVIQERVLGTINEVRPLGGWFSNDRSVYYYAMYRLL